MQPKQGEQFTYNGIDFIALSFVTKGTLAVKATPLEKVRAFDVGGSNNWSSSSLRSYLNTEWIKAFDKKDIVPLSTSLQPFDGAALYGETIDYVTMLNFELFKYAFDILPKINAWIWTLTPYTCYDTKIKMNLAVNCNSKVIFDRAVTAELAILPIVFFNNHIFTE